LAGSQAPACQSFSLKLLLDRSPGSWSFKNTIPERELGNEQNIAAAEKLAVFRTTAFSAERIKRANPGDMLSILELAGTDEIEIECHDLIELHSSTAFSTSKSYLIASGWCWIYV